MKEEKISSRFAKVFAVASLITDRGERGCTIYEIMDILGVNNRSSAFNVLETLDEMGFAYYTEKSSDGSRKMLYKIEPDMAAKWKNSIVSGVLSEDDIRFLNFVLETVSSTSPLMEMCGSDFISRLRMVINPNTKSEINPLLSRFGSFFKLSPEYFKTLLLLLEASEKKIKCHVVYESRNSESEVEYDIYPLKVIVQVGAVYAEGLNNYGQRQLLAISRIQRLTKLRHEKYPEIEQSNDFEDPFPFYQTAEPFIAEVLIDEYQGWYEIQKAWPKSVTFRQQEDGSYLFTLKTASPYGLQKWLMSMGSSAVLIKPESMRTQVKEELETIILRYQGKSSFAHLSQQDSLER